MVKWLSFKSISKTEIPSVNARISEAHFNKVKENRKYLKLLSRILILTAKHGIAQRGHDETSDSVNKGNFLEILNLVQDYNEDIKDYIDKLAGNAKYQCPEIQNEILSISAKNVLMKITSELKECDCFAIMVDESKDF